MNEGVWVRGAAPEEFVCEMIDQLADWDHLEEMYVYRIPSVLRCYLTFYAKHCEVIHLIKNYVNV
jgi:hypothetical protein